MISVSRITYSFPDGKSLDFPGFQLARGEHALLLGQSGSGKTTLLHLLGGLRRGYGGSIRINDTELSSLSPSELDHFRGQHIGFVFQRNHLLQALTVEDNLRLAPYLAGLPIDNQRIIHVLGQLGLADQRKKHIHQLSQGQAQRVAIARAVINRPLVVFADEPTSALDDVNCSRVMDLLINTAHEHGSLLLVATHDRRVMDSLKQQILLS